MIVGEYNPVKLHTEPTGEKQVVHFSSLQLEVEVGPNRQPPFVSRFSTRDHVKMLQLCCEQRVLQRSSSPPQTGSIEPLNVDTENTQN